MKIYCVFTCDWDGLFLKRVFSSEAKAKKWVEQQTDRDGFDIEEWIVDENIS